MSAERSQKGDYLNYTPPKSEMHGLLAKKPSQEAVLNTVNSMRNIQHMMDTDVRAL